MSKLASTLSLLLLMAVACGGKSQPAPAEPVQPVAEADAAPVAVEPEPAKLTDVQCNEMFDQVIKLMQADPEEKPYVKSMKGEHDKYVASCVENGTKALYDCTLAAKTVAEQQACK